MINWTEYITLNLGKTVDQHRTSINLRKAVFDIIFDFGQILSQVNHLELIYDDVCDNRSPLLLSRMCRFTADR